MNTEYSQQCQAFCNQSTDINCELVLAAVFHFFGSSLVQQGAASPAIDAVQSLLPQMRGNLAALWLSDAPYQAIDGSPQLQHFRPKRELPNCFDGW